MKSSVFADLLSAQFDLRRSLLQLQDGQQSCRLAEMTLQIAEAETDLALIHHAQTQLTLRRSQNGKT